MNAKPLLLALFFLLLVISARAQKALPQSQRLHWWQHDRFGMFIHWGPATLTGQEISWSREEYGKSRYDSLHLRFNPTQFNPKEWVRQAKAGGLKYVVLTAKHHDGFCLWNTQTTSYNIMSSPFGRDVCKELADAVHEAGLQLGWYFSPGDWKDPDCRNPDAEKNRAFENRMLQQLTELLTNYGKISLLWIDYDAYPCPTHPKNVYELAHRLQPGIILNNRLEAFNPDESHSQPGRYGDYVTPEGFVAGYGNVPWETCTNMGHQWAWRFNDTPRPLKEVVHTLLRCVGGNGNLLLNVGPDSLGQIPPLFTSRLQEVGEWIRPRAEAIYGTQGGPYTPTPDYVCTQRGNRVFLHWLAGPTRELRLPALPATIKKAKLLNGPPVPFSQANDQLRLVVPASAHDSIATIVELTLDRPASQLAPILPFSQTGSLAYGQKPAASSAVGEFLHGAGAAFDDNKATYWKLGRRPDANFDASYGKSLYFRSKEVLAMFEDTGWLEIDLGKPQLVGQIVIHEFQRKNRPGLHAQIDRFSVQYQKGSKWLPIATGQQIGDEWRKEIAPVTAQRFRLVILESKGGIGVSEFQLFPPKNQTAN
ncbi:alpha-L-fucosidase [Larkinella bovis]|uniref:alpha-L-fucosidase n=1 Tax=Larkinella bovis TaxID=683041 RepID=A0ABW0IID9_9BACT